MIDTLLPEVKLIRPKRHRNPRGVFAETYSEAVLAAFGITAQFVQDNHSISLRAGTVCGLHFQIPPFAQAKLVRVVRGAVFDVAVDLRRGSPTFGRHVAAILTAADWSMPFIPEGFAHDFCTLADDTEVVYKASAPYAPTHDRGIFWADPDLAIDWPVAEEAAILSEKDRRQPRLAELADWFHHSPPAGPERRGDERPAHAG
nr:dTDP-4-dehydrorhamnose 3,5-epimerase [Elioraea thermophila]